MKDLSLPYRWCFGHNDMECVHEDDIAAHCFSIDSNEDYSGCDVRDAIVLPEEEL